ncbi:MAG: hypothetical protein K8S98_14855 [Planctomycetes bacterium]|nr:hypothetical protein [Planctomycetota bacterium]
MLAALHTSLSLALVAVASPSLAATSTFVVDASGGGDFTDLPLAISTAPPASIVVIKNGAYSGFTLDKRLTLVGEGPGVVINGMVIVQNVTTGSSTVIAGMTWNAGARVLNCTKPIVFDAIQSNELVFVQGSTDVRIARSTISTSAVFGFYQDGYPGLEVDGARVEFVESSSTGAAGADDYDPVQAYGGFGGDGLQAHGVGADVHIYRTNLQGGEGGAGIGTFEPYGDGGDGGHGLRLFGGARALVAGTSAFALTGGIGGYSSSYQSLAGTGRSLSADQSEVRYSGESVATVSTFQTLVEQPIPDDPSLFILSTPTAGQNETFRVRAEPGSTVDLLMGRNATITPYGNLEEDLLLQKLRVFHLGVVSGSGSVSLNFPMPAFPTGFVFFAQARVTLPSSEMRYSNSVPLIVR